MDEKVKCTCRWKSCKRHGKCEECIEHHSKNPKYPLPFCNNRKIPLKLCRKHKVGKGKG